MIILLGYLMAIKKFGILFEKGDEILHIFKVYVYFSSNFNTSFFFELIALSAFGNMLMDILNHLQLWR
jgi:hypothetical protein